MSAGSSPGTSEMASVTRRAGWQATPSRPPLMRERWRRTVLISPIAAPERSSARVSACLSSRDSPSAGSGSSADPPPDSRHSTRSSAPRPCTRPNRRSAARRPASAGTGCADSSTSIRSQATAWPWGVTTVPLSSPSQCDSTARAIAAAALPAPTTTVRPAGGGGSAGGTQRAALAASMAAAKAARSRRSGSREGTRVGMTGDDDSVS